MRAPWHTLCLAGLIALGSSAPATAQDLNTVPFGILDDLRACFDADLVRGQQGCARAASGIGHAGWRAYLLREDTPTSASAQDQIVYHALRCAEGRLKPAQTAGDLIGTSCDALRIDAAGRGALLSATGYFVEACAHRSGDVCRQLGISTSNRDADHNLLLPPPATETRGLGELAQACAYDDPVTCLTLLRQVNRARISAGGLAPAREELKAACDQKKAPAACEMIALLDHPDAPANPALGPTLELLERVTAKDASRAGAEAVAALLSSGTGLAYGDYGARRFAAYACGKRTDACNFLDRAYRSTLHAVIDAACTRILEGGPGDPRACAEVSRMRRRGQGLAKDVAVAQKREGQACDAGDYQPCVWKANAARKEAKRHDEGSPPYVSKMMEGHLWSTKACEHGNPKSCGVISFDLSQGSFGLAKDVARAKKLAEQACKDGSGYGCARWGEVLYTDRKQDRAATALDRGCGTGDGHACAALGVLLGRGDAGPKDTEGGLWLMRRECMHGEGADACLYLGQAYSDPDARLAFLGRDDARARWALKRACDKKSTEACERLATLGEGPETVPPEGKRPARLRAKVATPTKPPWSRPSKPAPASPATPSSANSSGSGSSSSWSSDPDDPYGMLWVGTELAFSSRDSAAAGRNPDHYPDQRFTYLGLELGGLYAEPNGLGGRYQLSYSFDWGASFDDSVSTNALYGGTHGEFLFEAFYAFGGEVQFGLGLGWHGLLGPITRNSSISGAVYLLGPAWDGGVSWFLRVEPVQILAANERMFLSPFIAELRLIFGDDSGGGGVAIGVEGQYIAAREAGEEDIAATDAFAILFKLGMGAGGID